jgi:hypothetical protein
MALCKERGQMTFSLPAASGSYSAERITVGAVRSGMPEDAFQGITISVDTSVSGMSCELWLPRVGKAAGTLLDTDYKYTGKSIGATGSETWALAGYPGAQIRVKSGGSAGSPVLSYSAF